MSAYDNTVELLTNSRDIGINAGGIFDVSGTFKHHSVQMGLST